MEVSRSRQRQQLSQRHPALARKLAGGCEPANGSAPDADAEADKQHQQHRVAQLRQAIAANIKKATAALQAEGQQGGERKQIHPSGDG